MNNQSEFICQVVLVVKTEPHPNADRLDLVTISLDGDITNHFPQKIINSKGGLQIGHRAVYIGPDSVVPLDRPEFEFLKDRLDAKGKTHYRIRSARIRGVYSPGLLIGMSTIPAAISGISSDTSTYLGVTNWTSEPNSPGASSVGGMSKVRAKDIYPVYSVYSLKKCPTLFKEGELVHVTEKIHGTNFRFGYGGKRRFYYGTHRTALTDTRGFFARLWSRITGRSRINTNPGFNNPWAQAVEDFALEEACEETPEYIFYGEIFGVTKSGASVQPGFSYGAKGLKLQIFDIYDPKENRWLSWYERWVVCSRVGLEMSRGVPVSTGNNGGMLFNLEKVKELAEKDSYYGGICEGVVVEAIGGEPRKAKWVSERYHLSKHD